LPHKRLKCKLLNKKPLDDNDIDNYENECDF